MPLSTHPVIRSLQEALESNGLIKAIDSQGKVVLDNAISAGTRPAKVVPVAHFRIIRGTKYTAS